MVVQHNLPAMNSHRQLGINTSSTAKNLEKLSSGLRVNRAGDDAAGLAISEKMRGQIRGLDMATTNAENGVSLLQTAEGGLNETHSVLQRMRELSVQSSNGTYANAVDRENIDKEVQALKNELDRIASSTHYNGIKLLDGSMGGETLTTDATKNAAAIAKAFGAAPGGVSVNFASADGAKYFGLKDGDSVNATLSFDKTNGVYALQIGDKTLTSTTTDFKADVNGTMTTIASLDAAFTTATQSGVVSGITMKIKDSSGTLVDDTAAFSAQAGAIVAGKDTKLTFQIGANGSSDQQVKLHVDNMSSGFLGATKAKVNLNGNKVADVEVTTRDKANESIGVIDAAVNQVSGTRADLGALQNRLEHTINNLGTTKENLQAAESSIRDVDMAKEMMDFTKNNILSQASQAMLAQSNTLPQGVLTLLK